MPPEVNRRGRFTKFSYQILNKSMKKLSLNASVFQKGEVLTKSQLKKVLGGDGSGTEPGGGLIQCRYKYKYSETDDWTNWSDWTDSLVSCNSNCLTFINQGSVIHCGYESRAV
jgi:hypothetical protein